MSCRKNIKLQTQELSLNIFISMKAHQKFTRISGVEFKKTIYFDKCIKQKTNHKLSNTILGLT